MLISLFGVQINHASQIKNFFNELCTFYYGNQQIDYVYCSTQGYSRRSQQDTILVQKEIVSKSNACHNVDPVSDVLIQKGTHRVSNSKYKRGFICGVFDGHGRFGEKVSQYAAQFFKDNSGKGLAELCDEVDKEILRDPKINTDGSTALLFSLDYKGSINLVNIGDSRGLWGVGQDCSTKDHNVENEVELNRINDVPGLKIQGSRIGYNGSDWLALTRAFGDSDFRKNLESESLVISTPDIYPLPKDTSLVFMGCDGCFDYTSSDQIYKFCQDSLKKSKDLEWIAWCVLLYIANADIANSEGKAVPDCRVEIYPNVVYKVKNLYAKAVRSVQSSEYPLLHDNTSFIILNINPVSGEKPYIKYMNNQRWSLVALIMIIVAGYKLRN